MKTRIKGTKEKIRMRIGREEGESKKEMFVERALSRGRLESGRAAVPGAHTATGVVQLNRAEI